MISTQFFDSDLAEGVPPAGFYVSTIRTARMRASQRGNAMVHVIHEVEGVPPAYERVSEYFVLDGASPRGLAFARRRLVELFRACGVEPRPGEAIAPERLVGARVRVQVGHEEWRGEVQLRVVGHLPAIEPSDSLLSAAKGAVEPTPS